MIYELVKNGFTIFHEVKMLLLQRVGVYIKSQRLIVKPT